MASLVLDQLETFGPDQCRSLTYDQADRYVRRLVNSQYENFTVVSTLLPRRLRPDFRHVYGFCRWADDLGDEVGDRNRALTLLDWWRDELARCYAGDPRHPVFVALKPTIDRHQLPRQPFDDLIDAFVQDQSVSRYETWAQVLDYCTRSANPVGRLVVYLCGYRDARREELSDRTCTALQLANFWQDVRRDIDERDRVYLPREVAATHGLDIERMVRAVKAEPRVQSGGSESDLSHLLPACRQTIQTLVDRTWPMFAEGRALLPMLDASVRPSVKLFTRGGETVLEMIEARDYETLTVRPRVTRAKKARLLALGFADKVRGLQIGHP